MRSCSRPRRSTSPGDPVTNKGEVFATLTGDLPLPFAAEKAGGLLRPDSVIKGISRALGPVANPNDVRTGTFNTSVFDNASFPGTIKLSAILARSSAFDRDAAGLPLDQLLRSLEDPGFKLPIPVLANRDIFGPGAAGGSVPVAVETRFLWKPEVISKPESTDFIGYRPRPFAENAL